jgi:hypothetical protein
MSAITDFYIGTELIAQRYPGKRKEKKYKIFSPYDLFILAWDEEVWLFREDGTRDSEIRTIGDLLEAKYGKETIKKIKNKENK